MHLINTDLPGAVVAGQRGDLAGRDVEIDVDDRVDRAEALADAPEPEEGLRTR